MTNKEIENMANNIRSKWQARGWYVLMRSLMFIEGIVWSIMDMTRALRMKVAGHINKYYK